VAKRPHRPESASLEGFYRHFDVEECLMFVAREMGRLGVEKDRLLEYQGDLLRDLKDPLDEEALAKLHEYWDYDLEQLFERGRQWRNNVPAKPRIDIVLELTSKDNLKAEWFPRGWDPYEGAFGKPEPTDFRHWYRQDHRRVAFDSRPSNELMFLRGAGRALRTLETEPPYGHPLRILDHVFISACWHAVQRLKSRLERHFEVRMVADAFVEWDEPDFDDWSDMRPPRLVSLVIENPEKRNARAERLEIEDMEIQLGFSVNAFLAAVAECQGRKATGPAPSAHTIVARVTKRLKAEGFGATPTKVERAYMLLRKHRPAEIANAEQGPLGAATD
jgi:hypothetical protein